VVLLGHLKTHFFPKNLAYLSYVNVGLPADPPLSATSEAAKITEAVLLQASSDYGKMHSMNAQQPPRGGTDGAPQKPGSLANGTVTHVVPSGCHPPLSDGDLRPFLTDS
jgi:hypothetical protein